METINTYKLLRQDEDGTLHPLFIDAAQVLPLNQWMEARAPDELVLMYLPDGFSLIDMREQRMVINQDRRPNARQVNDATRRNCRWVEVARGKQGRHIYDLGLATSRQVIRFAHRPGWHTSREPSLPCVSMDGKVWAECLIPAEDHTIRRMSINGMTAKSQPVEWYISKLLKVVSLVCPHK